MSEGPADPARLAALGLRASHLSDARDELGLPTNAGGGYRLLGGAGRTAFGRAFTLRQTRLGEGEAGEARQGEAALSLAKPGDVLVIDADDILDVVTWGEAHGLRAQANGLSGVVLHGATRDAEALASGPLPVLCRGTSPVRSKGRLATVAIGDPVTIGGVRVAAGDLVGLDGDGLVAVSPADEAAVVERALAIVAREAERDEALRRR